MAERTGCTAASIVNVCFDLDLDLALVPCRTRLVLPHVRMPSSPVLLKPPLLVQTRISILLLNPGTNTNMATAVIR